MEIQTIHTAIWFLWLATAALSDLRTQKIPNRLILSGVILATALAALQGGSVFWDAVAGGTAALVTGFLFWKLHIWKAGDAKLLWMTMQFAGLVHWPQHMTAILLTGGVCALCIMLRYGILWERMRRLAQYVGGMLLMRRYMAYQPVQNDPVKFPFAVAVLLGELVAWITLQIQ